MGADITETVFNDAATTSGVAADVVDVNRI